MYAFINIFGLAIGIASCQLAVTYVVHETSFDDFHSKGERIYRWIGESDRPEGPDRYAKIPFPVSQVLIDNVPEIEEVTRFYSNTNVGGEPLMKYGELSFFEDKVYYVDPNLFEVFDFTILRGNPQVALLDNNNIILTQSAAKKYFGDADPIGRQIEYNGEGAMTVAGIIADVPANSHIQFDFLIPLRRLRDQWVMNYGYDFENDWKWSGGITFTLLKENTSIEDVLAKLPAITESTFPNEKNEDYRILPQHLQTIYLESNIRGEMGPTNSTNRLYLFSGVALLILFIAMVNFMNLATARSMKRAREVGVRKVLGARKRILIYQFVGEALVVAVIAMLHAFVVLNLTLPIFNTFTEKNFKFLEVVSDPLIFLCSVSITIVTGLLSGIYPAFFLSSFNPVNTIKGAFHSLENINLRKALVIFQLTITTVFILAILVITLQVNFIKNRDLGFNKEEIVILPMQNGINNNFTTFSEQLKAHSGITGTYKGNILGDRVWSNTITPEGFDPNGGIFMNIMYCGERFVQMFGLDVVEGRGFDRLIDTDSLMDRSSFLVNEAAVQKFMWLDGAVGKEIKWIGGNDNKTIIKGKVVGVLKDFNYRSLHHQIEPIVIRLAGWGKVAVKIRPEQIAESIEHIETTWEVMVPEWNFEFSFLNEDLNKQYKKERKLSTLTRYFAGLAVFISCLGIFGLVAFMAQQKKKEIAIRKTLGATVQQLVSLMSSDFVKLVLVSGVIGVIIGYYIMIQWLDQFAYRITIHPLIFLSVILISLIISLVTISLQSIRAASENPIEALRNE